VDVVEEQLRGVLGLEADLVEVAAALEALHAALDHEQADALVAGVGVGAGHDDHEVGEDAVGDERLRAVEDVVVALVDGRGADALQVGAGARLGHRDRARSSPEHSRAASAASAPRSPSEEVGDDHVVVQREAEP
jgi:hypothetical protein